MTESTHMDPAHKLESNVRSYCRSFPCVFTRSRGTKIWDEDGNEYLDFLAGAGTLNYGHNNPLIREAVMEHLESEQIVHGLDMSTTAKKQFIDTFDRIILKPRKLNYKLQFCGPTGTNAVEAALKIARKVTGRPGVISFTNGYHGMTLGALAVTGNFYHKEAIPGLNPGHAHFMPYDGYVDGMEGSTLSLLRQYLADNSSGVSLPAAVIVETVQGEGGINVARMEWLKELRAICDEYDIFLIIDDIQMGCGRTGEFFSFEEAGIVPDIVTLSKSIGAYGLPMALVLLKPELDAHWTPGQHNGTFRGHNLAFAAATRALELYWQTHELANSVRHKSGIAREALTKIAGRHKQHIVEARGRGLALAMDFRSNPELACQVREACFAERLIVETCGSEDHVLKLLPPLTISEAELRKGLDIIARSVDAVIAQSTGKAKVSGGKA